MARMRLSKFTTPLLLLLMVLNQAMLALAYGSTSPCCFLCLGKQPRQGAGNTHNRILFLRLVLMVVLPVGSWQQTQGSSHITINVVIHRLGFYDAKVE